MRRYEENRCAPNIPPPNFGGTPHLDGQYTVFGEVEEGLDVVEMIQQTATGRGDRPVDDIEMRITVVE